jgi:hypothetical protein
MGAADESVAKRPRTHRAPLILGVFMLILIIPMSSADPPTAEIPTGPGSSWFLPETNNLFLNSETGLNRTFPMATGQPAGVRFSRTDSTISPQIVTSSSDPLVNGLSYEGNLTVRLYSALESESDGCRFVNQLPAPADALTSFLVTINAGGVEVGSGETNREVLEYDWRTPAEFLFTLENIEFSLGDGDTIDLEINVRHNCPQAAYLYWNAYAAPSGIVLDGDIYSPELDAQVDFNRVARLELTPLSPWGPEDYLRTRIELVGPHRNWQDAVHRNYEEETHLDHFETPHGSRIGEGNRTIWTWTANGSLGDGIHMVDACIVLRDQDQNEDCHMVGVTRFMAPEVPAPLLSKMFILLFLPLSLLAWLASSLRIGLLPWPGYVVLGLMVMALAGPAMQLPDIENGGVRDETAVPPFSVLQHGGGEGSLSSLMEGNDVLVLGIFEVDSPAAEIQRRDFLNASSVVGEKVAFAQLATGDSVISVDLDRYAALVNGTWPLLMDEPNAGVASLLPSGAADAVVVIDKAGFVSSWATGSMDHNRIVNEVEAASSGSRKTPFDLVSNILFGGLALIPLALLALPREKESAPDAVLVPGAGILGTAAGAALGFGFIALPTILMALILRGGFWVYIETLLAAWMFWHALSMLRKGHIPEVRIGVRRIYNKLPQGFRDWRDEGVFEDDVLLGLWLGWMAFLLDPLLLVQGVASRMMIGVGGIASGFGMLIGFLVMAGICVVIIRGVATIGGPFSRIGGMFSQGARPRLWGAAVLVLAIWNIAVIVAGPLLSRLL